VLDAAGIAIAIHPTSTRAIRRMASTTSFMPLGLIMSRQRSSKPWPMRRRRCRWK
jgi:hypothetical protein